jgi:hypothetical protein
MSNTTYTKKYPWGRLAITADFSRASSLISYATDEDITDDGRESEPTPFQVSSARHNPKIALNIVNEWLATQAG